MIEENNRNDLTWEIGDSVFFFRPEYTWSNDQKYQDAWIGDTGTIISINKQHFCEEDNFEIWFDIQIDQSCLNDDRDRWCSICVGTIDSVINITKRNNV